VAIDAVGSAAGAGALLEVQSLCRAFGGVRAVWDLTFHVAPGEILGVLGPNGSGKTTVFNLVAGALAADSGEVVFGGRAITRLAPHGRSALGIARTYQQVRSLPRLSALDNVAVARLYGARPAVTTSVARREAGDLLQRVGLAWARDLPAGRLTVAERKRLEVARALATRPRLLLLDEPLAGLNPHEAAEALALFAGIHDDGVTVMIVEHNVGAVRAFCGRIMVLNSGQKIAEGPPDPVLADPRVVEVYLGERAAVASGSTGGVGVP
jgi:ABC-type branched-subunit amino acid transport system ATPase component